MNRPFARIASVRVRGIPFGLEAVQTPLTQATWIWDRLLRRSNGRPRTLRGHCPGYRHRPDSGHNNQRQRASKDSALQFQAIE